MKSTTLKSTTLQGSQLTGIDWVQANLRALLLLTAIALAVICAIIAAWVVYSNRRDAAASALGAALTTYNTPLADGSQQIPPGMKTFPNAAARATAAHPEFEAIANKYSSLESGENALYFAGLTAAEMGNNGPAETELKKAAGVGNRDIASLAKFALANLYVQNGRNADADRLLHELIAKPTAAVPAGSAQLALASMYQTTNPAAATRIYTTLKDQDKTGAAGEIAAQKLAGK